jgi:hypothetical protein
LRVPAGELVHSGSADALGRRGRRRVDFNDDLQAHVFSAGVVAGVGWADVWITRTARPAAMIRFSVHPVAAATMPTGDNVLGTVEQIADVQDLLGHRPVYQSTTASAGWRCRSRA